MGKTVLSKSLFPHFLFGNYIVEIAKLFSMRFSKFQLYGTAKELPLQVYYGTPRAAFRFWYKKFNGQMLLPSLNFYGTSYHRRLDKECPNTSLELSDPRSYNPADGTVAVTKPPMHYDVTYQFSIFNNNARERDALIHQILQMFPRGSCSLRWFPDPIIYPEIFLFMPLTMEDDFTDDTEIEGLPENETRDIIRTTFNIISSAVLPYDILRIPAVTQVFLNNNIKEDEANRGSIYINNKIGNSVSWFEYWSNTNNGLNVIGESDYALNQKWFYHYNGNGKILLRN